MRVIYDLACWVFFTSLLAVAIVTTPVLLAIGLLVDGRTKE